MHCPVRLAACRSQHLRTGRFRPLPEHLTGGCCAFASAWAASAFSSLKHQQAGSAEQQQAGDVQAHRGWIKKGCDALLRPHVIAIQRVGKEQRVVFSGDQAAVMVSARARRRSGYDNSY